MRAITVRQPWAWQIVNQRKNIENRTRNIAGKYRGPVAIHAALKADEEALRRLPRRAPEWVTEPRVFDYGVFLGVVDLIDVHYAHSCLKRREGIALVGPPEPCCEPWGQRSDVYHLVLDNPRPIPLKDQFTYRGALGLWTPPPDIADRIRKLVDA
jgi:hypothetical protein